MEYASKMQEHGGKLEGKVELSMEERQDTKVPILTMEARKGPKGVAGASSPPVYE